MVEGKGEVRQAGASEDLVMQLQAIASPNRFRLLEMLEEPHGVGDIELEASLEGGNAERSITRQGVRHHLNKLREAGFVRVRSAGKASRGGHEYVVDRRRLYELGETLRGMPSSTKGDLDAPPTWETPPGRSLTVVHGEEIGRSYPLEDAASLSGRGWVIGHREDLDVPLPWDPYVDDQAGEIERTSDGFSLIDLRAAQRRVSLNGRKFDRGEIHDLESGDLIGAGRSVLRFEV